MYNTMTDLKQEHHGESQIMKMNPPPNKMNDNGYYIYVKLLMTNIATRQKQYGSISSIGTINHSNWIKVIVLCHLHEDKPSIG